MSSTNANTGVPPPPANGPKVIPVPDPDQPTTTTPPRITTPPPDNGINPSQPPRFPSSGGPGTGIPPCPSGGICFTRNNGTNEATSPTTMTTSITAIDMNTNDDDFSSGDETRDNSNTSSVHVTPRSKQLRFQSRKPMRTQSPSHMPVESNIGASVLSCELALLNALSSDMEGAMDGLNQEQWKVRMAQINQVVRMVQWEAVGRGL